MAVERDDIDPVFMRRKFLLRQKHLAISEKYYVWDESGNSILFIQRPAHLLQNLGAIVAGLAAAMVVLAAFIAASSVLTGAARGIVIGVGIAATLAALGIVGFGLSAKRHVYFYRDDTKQELLLRVDQDQKFAPIIATYTVKDAAGACLARLRKNYLYNILRKRWYCFAGDGRLLSTIKEDSFILSIFRRLFGPLFGILRTNFVLLKGDTDEPLGEFNRNFTLLDRYVLDMSEDASEHLDPRVALAIGVMLDTGERR